MTDPRTVKGGTCRDCHYSDFYLTIVTCKLHAAAPALLEALEKILVKWGNLHPDDRDLARAAIEAAK